MSEVEITVGGRKYAIACNPGEESDVLAASEELNEEAKNIINSVGKVSDLKLLLMAGLMVSGRFKSIEKESVAKNTEISKLQKELTILKGQNQELTNLHDKNENKEKFDKTKPYVDDVLVTKMLRTIHKRLNNLLEEGEVDQKDKEVINNIDEIREVSSDQKKLF